MITDKQLLKDWEKFVVETDASNEDCLKALDKLRQGIAVDRVIRMWRKKEKRIGEQEAEKAFVQIFKMKDCIGDMRHDLINGKEKGSTTHIDLLDPAWTWRLSEFNIDTGYSNEGKSLFLRFLSLIKGIKDNWPSAFYAPEDYPAKEFFDDIIHTASGYSTDKDNANFINQQLYDEVYEKIKDLFSFVYLRPPNNTLIEVLKAFIPLIKEQGVKICVIDPLIKVARPPEYMNADDKYAGYVTTLCTDFARTFNVSLHLIMHQLTPRLQENGLYPKPTKYNIKGGGTWSDGSDNILTLWRPQYARDKVDDEVIFTSEKIRKQKLVGIPQDFKMRFNRKTNRYVDYNTQQDLFDFDTILRVPKIKLLFDGDE